MACVFLILLYIFISAVNLYGWAEHSDIQPNDATDWIMLSWLASLWPVSIIMLLASIYDNYHKK